MPAAPEFVVDFPTLWIVPDWIERHCIIPDSVLKGLPFVMYDWQLWCTVNHYRVKPDAVPAWTEKDDGTRVAPASAFFHRRSQVVAPQKALALDTPIATPGGWSTMGDLVVGDEVFDETGRPTRV